MTAAWSSYLITGFLFDQQNISSSAAIHVCLPKFTSQSVCAEAFLRLGQWTSSTTTVPGLWSWIGSYVLAWITEMAPTVNAEHVRAVGKPLESCVSDWNVSNVMWVWRSAWTRRIPWHLPITKHIDSQPCSALLCHQPCVWRFRAFSCHTHSYIVYPMLNCRLW